VCVRVCLGVYCYFYPCAHRATGDVCTRDLKIKNYAQLYIKAHFTSFTSLLQSWTFATQKNLYHLYMKANVLQSADPPRKIHSSIHHNPNLLSQYLISNGTTATAASTWFLKKVQSLRMTQNLQWFCQSLNIGGVGGGGGVKRPIRQHNFLK